jgi:hypothetical protein
VANEDRVGTGQGENTKGVGRIVFVLFPDNTLVDLSRVAFMEVVEWQSSSKDYFTIMTDLGNFGKFDTQKEAEAIFEQLVQASEPFRLMPDKEGNS